MKHTLLLFLFLFCGGVAMAQLNQAEESAVRKLTTAQIAIERYYVDTIGVKGLVESAIKGMLKELDPHSTYTNAAETKQLTEPLNGNFEGVGIQFSIIEDTLVVTQTVAKGPSQRVGILAGDRIISVNDTAVAGVKMNQNEIIRRLRGPKGTHVALGVLRVGQKEKITFDVIRDKIPLHTLDAAYMLTPEIGYIRFSSFGQTTASEVHEAIAKLQGLGMKSLVLDLQENGGGYLDAAQKVANEFLSSGDLIVYTKGRNVRSQELHAQGGGIFTKGKVVVLVDEYTASAAEILSGAIQDQDRGIIVGRRSFGKGLVQQPIPLGDGSMIRLTVARYYTPSGRCIQKPYKKGESEAYQLDVINRYRNGELSNPDSIHLTDSLKYQTLKEHRTVYGGGGIMPDHFVPIDTTQVPRYYRALSQKGLIARLALKYFDRNRKALAEKYPTFAAFKQHYVAPASVVSEIIQEGDKLKVTAKDAEEKTRSEKLLAKIIKALVARDLWSSSEYLEIVNDDNPSILRAVRLLETGK